MKSLEKLDKSMNQLYLELMKYNEDDVEYKTILSTLNQQYQLFKGYLDIADDGKNNTYYFKYSDIGAIEQILATAGYIEEQNKSSRR